MFKFDLNQLVFYLRNNKIHSAPILSRMLVDNKTGDYQGTDAQKRLFNHFGQSRILYATVHGEFSEDRLFDSKEELKNSL